MQCTSDWVAGTASHCLEFVHPLTTYEYMDEDSVPLWFDCVLHKPKGHRAVFVRGRYKSNGDIYSISEYLRILTAVARHPLFFVFHEWPYRLAMQPPTQTSKKTDPKKKNRLSRQSKSDQNNIANCAGNAETRSKVEQTPCVLTCSNQIKPSSRTGKQKKRKLTHQPLSIGKRLREERWNKSRQALQVCRS